MAMLVRRFSVSVKEDILRRKDWVKYLTMTEFHQHIIEKEYPGLLQANPTDEFLDYVNASIKKYMDGELPDRNIHSALMNCVDMISREEEVVLNTGDYISLMTAYRNSVDQQMG